MSEQQNPTGYVCVLHLSQLSYHVKRMTSLKPYAAGVKVYLNFSKSLLQNVTSVRKSWST